MYVSWEEPTAQDAAIRNKVRHAKILLELAERTSPEVHASPARAGRRREGLSVAAAEGRRRDPRARATSAPTC